jgi:tRNA A37 threonylcarbamoyladenosine biosynthesis protein TsaE
VPGSVLLVEWPERAEGRLGEVDISVALSYADGEARRLRVEAETPAGRRVLGRL